MAAPQLDPPQTARKGRGPHRLGDVLYWPPSVDPRQLVVAPGEVAMVFAGPGRRLVARILDTLALVAGIALLIGFRAVLGWPGWSLAPVTVAAFAWLLLYEPVLTTLYGGGLGKLALGIRVVRIAAPLRNLAFGWSLLRWVCAFLIRYVPVLGLLDAFWLLWDRPLRQCLHDKPLDTIVVLDPRRAGVPLPASTGGKPLAGG